MNDKAACTSRNIPLPIAREVRQRCGFGCVICGLPLYEYEHMLGWANVKRHLANEITLLCDKHHREKTNKFLPQAVVDEANLNPFNLRDGVIRPYDLHFQGDSAEIIIGSNSFTCINNKGETFMFPIVIDDIPLIGFILEDGHLLLNMVVFNEFNVPILHIKDNQLFQSAIPWDVQLVGTRLTVREGKGDILIDIEFNPPNRIKINRGRFVLNGVEIFVRPTHILIVNSGGIIARCVAHNCAGGLIVGKNLNRFGGFMAIERVSRSSGNLKAALKNEKKFLAGIK